MNNNIPYDMPSQASNDTNGESSPHNEVHTFTVTLPVIQGPPIVLGHPGNTAAAQSTVSNRMFPGSLCNGESSPHNEVHPFTVTMPAIQGPPIVLGHPGNAAAAQSTVPNRMPSQASNDTNDESSPHNEVHPFTVTLPAIQGSPIVLGHFGNAAAAQSAVSNRMAEGDEIPPPKPDFSAPPPYEVATKLPSYEEVQREKTLQGEPHPQIHMPGNLRTPQQPLTILAIDTETAEGDPESGLLGTDFMFFTAFLVAFLFNWIGFLLLMCFCHTIASRYGALSGFGLSLTKWTLIVKHSTDLASRENSWLWWLIMAFGVLICMRAIIQYLNIKRGWRLLSGSAQERLLFFY